MFVSCLVRTSLALGMTAFEESVTVPLRTPEPVCAHKAPASRAASTRKRYVRNIGSLPSTSIYDNLLRKKGDVNDPPSQFRCRSRPGRPRLGGETGSED